MVPIATGAPSYMIPINTTSRDNGAYRSPWSWFTRFFAAFCGFSIRLLLLAIVIIDLALASVMVERFTTATTTNGLTISTASPPSSVVFSEVAGAISLAYLLFSFCFFAIPMLLLVGDTIAFVAWFTATIILGVSLNQTLSYSCQTLAITLTGGTGVGLRRRGSELGSLSALTTNSLAQQVFDSCNLTKTLFAFHVIATILFVGTAANAAIQASAGGRRGRGSRGQRNRGLQPDDYVQADYRAHKSGGAPPMTEIVV